MPKALSGWIVDFRTARSIVSSRSNARIAHCVEQVAAGSMKICHSEASDFAGVPALKNTFGGSVEQADDSVLAKCAQLQGTGYFPGAGKFDLTPIYIVAIALVRNYGVLCDQRITPFVTTYSACCNFNVTVKQAEEYFSFLQ